MRKTLGIGIAAAACFFASTATSVAQFWPGYGYSGGYGAWGSVASAMNNRTSRYVAQSNRLMGERAAMQQQSALQSNIRGTLGSQAQARTQNIIGQQQSNRDWWFQTQQQQLARGRAMPSAGGGAMAAAGFEAARSTQRVPAAATDVINWLPVLGEPQFAQERTIIEAPYRREPKANPTPEDYQNMIDAAEQMKVILGRMTTELSAQEYINAGKFLDKLAAEARGRIQKDDASPKPPSK